MNESGSQPREDSTHKLLNDWSLASQPAWAVPPPASPDRENGPQPPAGWPGPPDPAGDADLGLPLGVSDGCARYRADWAVGNELASSAPAAFPRPGEMLGDFHLLSELGRGAFARVYLAEQVGLANRPVALKVSQALGDEPQMLARLQHAHIVPIHSVHDDPATGLRLLCMPYLGGANLAHVLETAGTRLPTQVSGKSLVDALDQIAHRRPRVELRSKHPARGSQPSTLARGSLLREQLQDGAGASGNRLRSRVWLAGAATRGVGSPSEVRSIWRRYWAHLPWRSRLERPDEGAAADGEAELAQPARRFLRKASYIQAAVWIAARLAEALEHAHTRGLLHRDLKPSNVLIAADGTPMLLDFNLSAESTGRRGSEEQKAMIGGTLPYMAPEHLDAFNPLGTTPPEAVDQRSDLYALGLILFEILAGQHPFADPPPSARPAEALAMMIEQRRQGAPSLKAVFPEVPWSLDAILRKCLAPEPDRRYQYAGDLAEDLRRFLDDLPLRHAVEPSLRERVAKWARRNPRATSSTTVALLSVLLILTFGGVLSLVVDRLQGAAARLQRSTFHAAFDECELLLNTMSGPPEHLRRGIARAEDALRGYGVEQPRDWTRGYLMRRLPATEQYAVREEASELILLVARAREYLAEHEGDERDRRRALEWATDWLPRAQAFDPHPPPSLFNDLAQYHAALGQATEAARARALRDRSPATTSRDFYLLGTAALAHGQPDQAEPNLLKSVERDPARFWAWFALGLCHADQKRNLEAAGDFNVCTALVPAFSWPHLNRGLALARAGRLGEARTAYDRALAANPRFTEAFVNRGLVCLELNDAAQAVSDLDRAFALGRREPVLRAARAEARARLGHRAEAQRELDDLVQARPDDPGLRVARGFFLLQDAATRASARRDFDRALEVAPSHARAHLGLAYWLRQTDPRAALEHADEALAADRSLTDAIELRALLRGRLGDPAATADVERLVQVPTPHRLYNAACALSLLSRTAHDPQLRPRAVKLLQRAVEAGFPAQALAQDADFEPLRALPEFQALASPGHAADAR